MKVPFHVPDVTDEEKQAVWDAMSSGWLTSGPIAAEFERQFAYTVGAENVVSCSSATTGCLALLMACGLGDGDEVIVPTWTFSSPAMMARLLGCKVVLVDVDPETYMPTLSMLAAAITSRTEAVIPTHFAGYCHPEIRAIRKMCHAANVLLLEDAAHAFPTRLPTAEMVGGPGAFATFFSFYATKTLTTGEGGMITTSDKKIADRLRKLLQNGLSKSGIDRHNGSKQDSWFYDVETMGVKGNFPDMLAAMGLVQLKRSPTMRMLRGVIAMHYHRAIDQECQNIDRVRREYGLSSWHLYPINVKEGCARQFIIMMKDRGVSCSKHFIPLHRHTYWREHCKGQFPNADKLFGRQVSLPIYSNMPLEMVDYVLDCMKEVGKAL